MKTTRTALLLMGLVLVAACGTKGPLVLPDKADEPDKTESPAAP
jgi:predicted small lipoprotein YifL